MLNYKIQKFLDIGIHLNVANVTYFNTYKYIFYNTVVVQYTHKMEKSILR